MTAGAEAVGLTVGDISLAVGTSDIADAHVVLCARLEDETVVTSDPDDLWRLDPDLVLLTL